MKLRRRQWAGPWRLDDGQWTRRARKPHGATLIHGPRVHPPADLEQRTTWWVTGDSTTTLDGDDWGGRWAALIRRRNRRGET